MRPRRRAGGLGDLPSDLSRQFPGSVAAAVAKRALKRPASLRGVFGTINGRTEVGAKVAVPGKRDRVFLEFQNQSLAVDMRLGFDVSPSADTGIIIPAGTTRIWDVVVPVNGVYIFCAVAGEPYAVGEAAEAD
jgi:hypothetical protein